PTCAGRSSAVPSIRGALTPWKSAAGSCLHFKRSTARQMHVTCIRGQHHRGPMADLLQLKGLKVHFPLQGAILSRLTGRRPEVIRAVDGIDLAIGAREIVALVGES